MMNARTLPLRTLGCTLLVAFVGMGSLAMTGCKSSTPGVKSNYIQQWTSVNGSLEEATKAAEEALSSYDLTDVDSTVTQVDGRATGMTADKTEVVVDIKPQTDETSEVSVRVGTVGDPDMGNNIIQKIKTNLAD
jgi:hypothetical protein